MKIDKFEYALMSLPLIYGFYKGSYHIFLGIGTVIVCLLIIRAFEKKRLNKK